jgi:hypothetical protein
MMSGTVQLVPITMLVLALATGGPCSEPEVKVRTELQFTFVGEELDELQAGTKTDAERCEAACRILAAGDGTHGYSTPAPADRIDGCMASGGDRTLEAWDPEQPKLRIECTVEGPAPR